MSAAATRDKARNAAAQPSAARCKAAGGATLGQEHSKEAQRLAALILEVLAGARTPAQAAAALAVSLPRYYQLETRALRGLVEGCAARPRGPGPNADRELAALRRQQERLQRELQRQQTLVRLTQRHLGLTPPPATPSQPAAGKKRRRRPVVRALAAAAHLQQRSQEMSVPPASAATEGQG
jgi:hypothetical protein